ncbi:MAG: hypothetical protein ACYDFT_00755 [Thermoplasmata archaeon]
MSFQETVEGHAPSAPLRRRAIAVFLAGAMLVVVVLAALTPNTGAIPAQSSCQYNNCVSPGSSAIPFWEWAIPAVILVVVVLAALLFLLKRRRRAPPAAEADEAAAEAAPETEEGA